MDGSFATGGINANITDSVAANNKGSGFSAFSSNTTVASLLVTRSATANNGTGILASGVGTTARIGQSAITGNTHTWQQIFGTVQSFGDNYIAGNADGDPAPAPIARK